MTHLRPAFAMVLLLGGCTTVSPTGRPDNVRIGQVAHVGGLRVTPESVIEDSRCPMNARCVWAGRVRLRVTVGGEGKAERRQLTLGEPSILNGHALVLTSVRPDRMANRALTPKDYRFDFEVRQ
ncbi:MAG: hypothetical protein ABW184_07025 [Sphingobium sp.]